MKFPDKIGILGGGQLGKMLCIAAADWHLNMHILDADPSFPAGKLCHTFTTGNFNNFEDVVNFGIDKDLITIEIEHVNIEALQYLKSKGVKIHPDPDKLAIIKDKGLQKLFYVEKGLPTAPFHLLNNKTAVLQNIQDGVISYPFVQKSRSEGYDGKGVAIIWNENDLGLLLEGECLIESMVNIQKEIAVVVCRNENGEIAAYPPVEMLFHPTANLVEFLLCPAQISAEKVQQAVHLAKETIGAYQICGLLAVELFLTTDDHWLINEVAPRPHNSGHHTIESCITSQFQQHLRGIMNLPMGSTAMKCNYGVMINILGSEGHEGIPNYDGLEQCLEIPGVHIHLYGKTITKPFRKMGHTTITGDQLEATLAKADIVKKSLKVVT